MKIYFTYDKIEIIHINIKLNIKSKKKLKVNIFILLILNKSSNTPINVFIIENTKWLKIGANIPSLSLKCFMG